MFKEHAIVLPALLLVAEFTVVRDVATMRARVAALRVPMLSLAVVALLYMLARSRVVVGGLSGFEPFIVFSAVRLTTANRVLTMVGAAPEWLRLFLWPARLMTEYTPQYVDLAQGPDVAQLPGLMVLLGTLGLIVATWRRSPITAFGITWLVLTLLPASNFVIPAGFIIAERTLILPSVGVVIALGSIVPWAYARLETRPALQAVAAVGVVVLIGLGLARSVTRNRDWHDNETLFQAAIHDAPTSYRAHFMYAVHLADHQRWPEAEYQFWSAIRLFPYDHLAVYSLADLYRSQGMCDKAIVQYRWLMALQPQWGRAHLNYATCLLAVGRADDARANALEALRDGTNIRYVRPVLQAIATSRAPAPRDSTQAPAGPT
jgi:Tfp pilus assembly protein PilF